jgi:hypothetical protein
MPSVESIAEDLVTHLQRKLKTGETLVAGPAVIITMLYDKHMLEGGHVVAFVCESCQSKFDVKGWKEKTENMSMGLEDFFHAVTSEEHLQVHGDSGGIRFIGLQYAVAKQE